MAMRRRSPLPTGHCRILPVRSARPSFGCGQSTRGFDPAGFLDGAEKAFRIIVTAFAAGDRGTLRSLLADDTYRAFEQAIAGREAAGQTQVSTIHSIHSATIENAELRGHDRPDHGALRV